MEDIIIIILATIAMSSAFLLGFIGIFVCAFKIPSNLFDYLENLQIINMYNSRPIMDIIVSENELPYKNTTYPLLGKYNGINGGHKYLGCYRTFPGSCYDDIKSGKEVYCPGDETKTKLIYEYCTNNINIPETNYSIYKSKFLYAEKTMRKIRYETLLTNAISENQPCPNNQKKCGYLNEGLVICYDMNETCPINDIIFDNNSIHSEGNINYTSLKINDNEYIHFTNEKTDNQIFFDLILSIEHPLSKIELPENEETNTFQLHENEIDMYYIGNIDGIKVFKQLYNTNLTYEEIARTYNIYDQMANDTRYKKSKFKSNMFIYKKNPIPFSRYTKKDIFDYNDGYHLAYVLNYVACAFLIVSSVFIILIVVIWYYRIFFVLGMALFDGVVILFFSLTIKYLSNSEIFNKDIDSFADKDYHRVQLLTLYCFYFSIAVLKILFGLFLIFYKPIKNDNSYDCNCDDCD
jgi:hypothetical protein